MLLENKVALITGASQGIGRGLAERFAEEGADLILCARNENALQEIAEIIKKKGREVLTIKTDVSDRESVDAAVKNSLDKYGRIDILVNNAGITRDNLLLRMSEEEWEAVINTNLKGTFLFTKACSKAMLKKKQGRIINISSIIGLFGSAGQSNYAASKGGVIAFSKSIAKELASRNILVNVIAPGFIQTDMTGQLPDERKELLLKQIPLGHFGEIKDIADAVVFLSSQYAKYITGQVIQVDGGMVI